MDTKYKDYFQIDENYFPCVNESAINAGLEWNEFYPHSTFIDLLKKTERMLSRSEKRSIWIFGAYGTGKSYAAFALSKLLTASDEEMEAYFNKYEALMPHRTDLMQRLIATKKEGHILVCYRYASSSINNSNDLIVIMQDLIAKAVERAGLKYTGADTLKQGILNWLQDERHKQLFNAYVEKEYKDLFGGWNTDEIIEKLNKSESSIELVGKINLMASETGFRIIKIDMDGLIAYIKDIVTGNGLKALVFVMDEFSEFFKNNLGRLSDFQKLVEICAEVPFYLIVVAHQMGSYFHEKDIDARKIKDRFSPCELSMPDNIAFDLMRDALKIKEEAKIDWEIKLDDLQDFTKKSRKAVSDIAEINDDVLRGILPLHPMSALLLKYISSAFESNQRSMFDFIKNDGDYKAFQWFIDNHGPLDHMTAFLTVDMLWNFFYETGGDNLAPSIKNILDTYKKAESHNLVMEEHQVLKTILIMQAVSSHLNDAIPLFIANDKNLHLCFEGTDYEHKAQAIADKLVKTEVLYKKTLGNNKFCYATMVMIGDAAELDKKKKEKIEKMRTSDLCTDDLMGAFNLPAPQKMRYCPILVTNEDISIKTNRIINEKHSTYFHAIIGVAKDDNEAVLLRKLMQDKIKNVVPDDRNIIYIDTTPTPFGVDSIGQYAEYMAGSELQRGKDNSAAEDMLRKGKNVVKIWSNRIISGQIVIYSKNNPEGERFNNWQQAISGLRELVETKYPQVFEFAQGLSEVTFQRGSKQQWVEAGINGKTSGQTGSAQKLVEAARKDGGYWYSNPYSSLSIIKTALDKKIEDELALNSRISIMDILTFLCDEYGFLPSHLYTFLTGFLLKEYANDTYRLSDESYSEKMNIERMKCVIDEGFKQIHMPISRYRERYIRIMSHNEELFCNLMSDVFEIPSNQCGSIEDTIIHIRLKEKFKGLPAWVLKEKACGIEVDFITEYVNLLNPNQGANVSLICGNIGKLVENDETLAQKLKVLVTDKNRRESMKSYLMVFEKGKLLSLAKEIGAEDKVIDDIQKHFGYDTEGLWLWNRDTGEGQIRKVISDYEFIKRSNELLIRTSSSVIGALDAWQEKLKFVKISHEIVRENSVYAPFIDILCSVARGMGRDYLREFYESLVNHGNAIVDLINSDRDIFAKSCVFQLQKLSEEEISKVYNSVPNACFIMGKQEYLSKITQIVSEYKANLAKIQLHKLWKEKTGTEYPYEWSIRYETPLLSCVPISMWSNYKRAFSAVNRQNPEDKEIKFALDFLTSNPIWEDISCQEKIDEAFVSDILGNYRSILTDLTEVRRYLKENTQVTAYDWGGHSEIFRLIKELAQDVYNYGPYERVMRLIESMDGNKLKDYLKRLVKDNMVVGIEILEDELGDRM